MKNQNIRTRLSVLRDALYYVTEGACTREIAEYRLRGRGAWKVLPLDLRLINPAKYDYRTFTSNVWLRGDTIVCANGYISQVLARRILRLVSKRKTFQLAGWEIIRHPNGELTVGCTTFSKADVARARQLLAS